MASWKIAELMLGPDDGSPERNDIECQIQEVMRLALRVDAEEFRRREGD